MSIKQNLIDQKEYLKKYLSGEKKKKKKDKRHKKHASRLKIIDDNVFAHEVNDIDEELLITGEDAPQIVGEVIEIEADTTIAPKWRNIAVKDEPQDDNEECKPDPANLWGVKKEDGQIKDEFSSRKRKIKKEPADSEMEADEAKAVDSDLSPPRHRRRHNSDSDLSLPRRGKSDDSDLLLPRRRRRRQPTDPKRRRSRSDDSDLSLPRRRRAGSADSDMSLPRRRRSDKNSKSSRDNAELSLPRRRRRGESADSDIASPRRRRRGGSTDSEMSLQRRRECSLSRNSRDRSRYEKNSKRRQIQNPEIIHSDNDSDLDVRRKRRSKDRSLTRVKVKREILSPEICHSDSETITNTKKNSRSSPVRIKEEKLTPPRKKHSRWNKADDNDARRSPPKNRYERKSSSPPPAHRGKDTRNRNERASSSPPPTHKGKTSKTLDGKKAGLQDAQALKLENEKRRREEERLFEQMSKDVSGRDAEIAVRKSGRKGRRGREAEEEDPEERKRREQREKQKKEVFDRWGKGVKQVEDYRQRLEEDAYEASKPLARYSNDEDLDRYLREQEHAEDPMLQYMREKKRQKAKDDNVPVIPKYEGTFPENRFGIRPGYRWDGVDRSNGYEKRWFEVRNEKRAREEEAYKYSVEDM